MADVKMGQMMSRVSYIFTMKSILNAMTDLGEERKVSEGWKEDIGAEVSKVLDLISTFKKKQAHLSRHADFVPGVSRYVYTPKEDLWAEFSLSVLNGSELREAKKLRRLLEYNMRLANKWVKWEIKQGPFTVKPVFLPHLESPFGMALTYKGGKVATLGGFIDQRSQGKTLVLNNIQNKILKIACAVVRSQQPYIPNYVPVNPLVFQKTLTAS